MTTSSNKDKGEIEEEVTRIHECSHKWEDTSSIHAITEDWWHAYRKCKICGIEQQGTFL